MPLQLTIRATSQKKHHRLKAVFLIFPVKAKQHLQYAKLGITWISGLSSNSLLCEMAKAEMIATQK